MKLFLTSSGLTKESSQLFLKNLNKKPSEIKFYFIPNAADTEPNGQEWVTKSMYQFSKIGINPIWYSIKDKQKETMQDELQDADVIWINGGNTFYLLDLARKTGFLEILKDLVLNKNVIYGGTSAGTLLACKSIKSPGWKEQDILNNPDMINFSGLNFVDFLAFVHYDKSLHKKDIQKNIKGDGAVYLIPDGSCVVVSDENIQLIGNVEILKYAFESRVTQNNE